MSDVWMLPLLGESGKCIETFKNMTLHFFNVWIFYIKQIQHLLEIQGDINKPPMYLSAHQE